MSPWAFTSSETQIRAPPHTKSWRRHCVHRLTGVRFLIWHHTFKICTFINPARLVGQPWRVQDIFLYTAYIANVNCELWALSRGRRAMGGLVFTVDRWRSQFLIVSWLVFVYMLDTLPVAQRTTPKHWMNNMNWCKQRYSKYLNGLKWKTKGAITSKIKHAIKLKTSPARLAQLLQPSLAFCFSLQPITAHWTVCHYWLQAKTKC